MNLITMFAESDIIDARGQFPCDGTRPGFYRYTDKCNMLEGSTNLNVMELQMPKYIHMGREFCMLWSKTMLC